MWSNAIKRALPCTLYHIFDTAIVHSDHKCCIFRARCIHTDHKNTASSMRAAFTQITQSLLPLELHRRTLTARAHGNKQLLHIDPKSAEALLRMCFMTHSSEQVSNRKSETLEQAAGRLGPPWRAFTPQQVSHLQRAQAMHSHERQRLLQMWLGVPEPPAPQLQQQQQQQQQQQSRPLPPIPTLLQQLAQHVDHAQNWQSELPLNEWCPVWLSLSKMQQVVEAWLTETQGNHGVDSQQHPPVQMVSRLRYHQQQQQQQQQHSGMGLPLQLQQRLALQAQLHELQRLQAVTLQRLPHIAPRVAAAQCQSPEIPKEPRTRRMRPPASMAMDPGTTSQAGHPTGGETQGGSEDTVGHHLPSPGDDVQQAIDRSTGGAKVDRLPLIMLSLARYAQSTPAELCDPLLLDAYACALSEEVCR
ncbi:hypothetical protein DUNSADRAFT_5161 [Dunaliella salina]|uniref:Uncharacterized protein n=1 Tax=Dunaliella salina TaxID=3046 RepID=A0ABQ7H7H8_DUNSA|nr:hypothetical protein DUNSADRAFT_5161 [Dunaliella salina]|eukprot:KAF5842789.1 hypothetical protein DUNSADRAFT_5161 [Dunaliella salina]